MYQWAIQSGCLQMRVSFSSLVDRVGILTRSICFCSVTDDSEEAVVPLDRSGSDALFLFSSYSKYTKAVIALVVISSIALGCSIIIAHFASYISHDTILKWLLPVGFTLLIIPSICMIAILSLMNGNRQVDLDGLSGRILVEDSIGNWTCSSTIMICLKLFQV